MSRARQLAALVIAAIGVGPAAVQAQLAQPQLEDANRVATSAEVEDRSGEPNRLRTGIEVGLVLTFATIRYQFDGERKKNWDFPSLKQRFTLEAWRYDNNPFGINNLWHAVEGYFFHIAARSNNLSLPESFAVGFLASFAWEFAFEFKEKVSINDVLFTPTTGVTVGEFFHWLGRYLDSAPDGGGIGHSIARWTLAFPYALHRKLDGRGAGRIEVEAELDNLGLRADIWHRFSLGASGTQLSGDVDGAEMLYAGNASAKLVAVRNYRRPGSIDLAFKNANFTEASYELVRGSDANGSRFRAESILVGLFRQKLDASNHGHGWLLGAALAYDYRREQLGNWRDRASLLHLPGLALEGEVHRGPLTARGGIRLHGDFVSMEAPAHAMWKAANPEVVEKTILRKQGYYFGWGGSVRAFLEVDKTRGFPVSLGASVLAGKYDSQENLDRNQETIEADIDVDTTLIDIDAHLRVGLRPEWPSLEIRASHQMRDSAQEGFEFSGQITRLGAGLVYAF